MHFHGSAAMRVARRLEETKSRYVQGRQHSGATVSRGEQDTLAPRKRISNVSFGLRRCGLWRSRPLTRLCKWRSMFRIWVALKINDNRCGGA